MGKPGRKAGKIAADNQHGKEKPASAAKEHFQAILANEKILRKELQENAIATVTAIGRPTSYNETIGQEICSRMALGESLTDITKSDHMPHRGTVYAWAQGPFRDAFMRARELQSEALLDDCVAIADAIGQPESDSKEKTQDIDINAQIQKAKLQIDTRLRVIAKMTPHKYGERIQHTGANGGPIQIAAITIDARTLQPDQREAFRNALLAAKSQENQPLTIDADPDEEA
jgi:hypothetical protein